MCASKRQETIQEQTDKPIKDMKRAIIILMALASYLASNAQLLYRITGDGVKSESYIIGTYHVADAAMVDSIPGAREALLSVEQVCGELAIADLMNADSLKTMMAYMYLPEGQTLQTLLPEADYDRLRSLISTISGGAMDNDAIDRTYGRMTPAMLTNNLTIALTMKNNHRKADMQNPMDIYLQRAAAGAGKPTMGLETLSFQAKTLFGIPMRRQVEQLMCLVDNLEFYETQIRSLSDAYYGQDMKKIEEAMEACIGTSCDSTPDEKDRLIKNRNLNWAKLMPAIMGTKPTLFAVGAGHLCGEHGMIQLLRNAGYCVEAVSR